jgi:hypothetical protein
MPDCSVEQGARLQRGQQRLLLFLTMMVMKKEQHFWGWTRLGQGQEVGGRCATNFEQSSKQKQPATTLSATVEARGDAMLGRVSRLRRTGIVLCG